jgi:nucleoid DNA-binding protein
MNKHEIIHKVATDLQMDPGIVRKVFDKTLQTMEDAWAKGINVQIRKYGTFIVKVMPPKELGPNHMSGGRRITLPERVKIRFSPTRHLTRKIDAVLLSKTPLKLDPDQYKNSIDELVG